MVEGHHACGKHLSCFAVDHLEADALNTNTSQEFTNHNLYAEVAMELGDNWFSEFWGDYFVWDGDFAAPDQFIINAGLERYFGEGQRFWLSLEARDILGQNNQVDLSLIHI